MKAVSGHRSQGDDSRPDGDELPELAWIYAEVTCEEENSPERSQMAVVTRGGVSSS